MGLIFLRNRVSGVAPAFDPATLFASGEEGVWYEPSTTTAFIGIVTLTPCGVGDAVATLLDKSQGAGFDGSAFTGLGSELVSNGTFDTDTTGWVSGRSNETLSLSSNKLRITADGAGACVGSSQITGLTVGKTYIVSCDLDAGTASSVEFFVGTASNLIARTGLNASTSTTASFNNRVFIATATTHYVGALFSASGAGEYVEIDNISVKELPGNHATQTTFDNRPTLARVPEGGRRNLLERTESLGTSPWGGSGTTATSAPSELDPNGNTGTVTRVTSDGSAFQTRFQNRVLVSGETYTISAWVKRATGTDQEFKLLGSNSRLSDDLTAGSTWQRVTYTFVATLSTSTANGFADNAAGDVYDIYVYGAQLELGSTATAYQKVVDEYDITESGVDSLDYLFDDETDDVLSWTAPADTDYTISYVNTSGTVTTLTSQSLSGATDILLDPAIVAYVAVDRALTAGETTNLETYLGALA